MSSERYPFPVAVSQLGEGDTRQQQTERAVRWLLAQGAAPLAVVTPLKSSIRGHQVLGSLITRHGAEHLAWRGLSGHQLRGRRVLHAWPDRERINDIWGVHAAALVVLEWVPAAIAEWIEDANPTRLLVSGTLAPTASPASPVADLPDEIVDILKYLADWAAGYDTGLKWNEEQELKADLMNRTQRWAKVPLNDIRRKCRELGLRPTDVDTIVGLIERRQQGHRFNVRHGYKDFHFNG